MMRSCLFCLLLVLPVLAQPAEVTRAYKAIPHRFTPFQSSQAKMQASESAYLKKNFALVNQAVVVKVESMQRRDYAGYDSKAASLVRQLKAQRPPKKLVKYHQLVIAAIEDQRAYFKTWKKNPSARFNPADPKVRAASGKLQQAYGILLRQFPGQAKKVQQAFFDHLCALDFL